MLLRNVVAILWICRNNYLHWKEEEAGYFFATQHTQSCIFEKDIRMGTYTLNEHAAINDDRRIKFIAATLWWND